jgi:hypothetical protein
MDVLPGSQIEAQIHRAAVVGDLFLPPRPGDRDGVFHDVVDVHRHEALFRPQPRELLNAPHRLGSVERGRLHHGERALQQRRVFGVGLHELRVAEDRLQQVVEVVGDAAGQLPDGLEPLRLVQALLELLALLASTNRGGDVTAPARRAEDLAVAVAQGRDRHSQRHALA